MKLIKLIVLPLLLSLLVNAAAIAVDCLGRELTDFTVTVRYDVDDPMTTVTGTPDDDVIYFTGGFNGGNILGAPLEINGLGGDDLICVENINVDIYDAKISGGEGDDIMVMIDDDISTFFWRTTFYGGEGDDIIITDTGFFNGDIYGFFNGQVYGGPGDDLILANGCEQVIDGGEDRIYTLHDYDQEYCRKYRFTLYPYYDYEI